jgi:hypothetical protein
VGELPNNDAGELLEARGVWQRFQKHCALCAFVVKNAQAKP